MHLKIPSAKWRPFCPGEDEFNARETWLPPLYFRTVNVYRKKKLIKLMNPFDIPVVAPKGLDELFFLCDTFGFNSQVTGYPTNIYSTKIVRTYAVLTGYRPSLPSLLHIAWMCPLSLALHWRHNESDGFPGKSPASRLFTKQRVLMHGHQGWNVRHGLCHIYMRYVYIYMSCL